MITITNLVDAIYITEGGANTKWLYGIKHHYKVTTPRQACFNTVRHAMCDMHTSLIDRRFITFLAARYCPPSSDPTGYHNWTNNVVHILNIK